MFCFVSTCYFCMLMFLKFHFRTLYINFSVSSVSLYQIIIANFDFFLFITPGINPFHQGIDILEVDIAERGIFLYRYHFWEYGSITNIDTSLFITEVFFSYCLTATRLKCSYIRAASIFVHFRTLCLKI